MKTEEDEAFEAIERKQGGFKAKRAMAADKLQEPTQEPIKLWLWKNFVNGKFEYLAFDNPFPIFMDSHDPQTLGEPCGYALLKPSRAGRTDFSDEQVLQDVQKALAQPAQEPVKHWSDCAMHNGPAYPAGPCDCGVAQEPINLLEARKIAAEYGTPDSQIDSGNLYFALMKCLEHIDAQPTQEPVAYVTGMSFGRFIVEPLNRAMVLPVGMALYSAPQGNT
jgi:hypothetical protein